MKKSSLFSIGLLLLAAPAAHAQFTYTAANGSVTITGVTDSGAGQSVLTIPNTIDGLPVTAIDAYVFEDDGSLTTITIGNRVTSIGGYAFSNCVNLTTLYFQGNAPTMFGASPFFHTGNFTAYYLPGTSGWTHDSNLPFALIDSAVMLNPPNPAGSLEVSISPGEAVTAGAYWQVDGGIPQPGGATVLGLTVGNHTVHFSPVSGFPTPFDQTVYVSANTTAETTGAYSLTTPTPMPTPSATATATPTMELCAGDCDGSGDVTVNEIIVLVNIALGIADQSACPSGIPSGADVDVALIVQGVNAALNRCGG